MEPLTLGLQGQSSTPTPQGTPWAKILLCLFIYCAFGLVGADKEAFGDEGVGSTKTGLTAAHFV